MQPSVAETVQLKSPTVDYRRPTLSYSNEREDNASAKQCHTR